MIPTAKEFLKEKGLFEVVSEGDIIDFAKLHVEAALKAAVLHAKVWVDPEPMPFGGPFRGVVEDSIVNAYPLDNIK